MKILFSILFLSFSLVAGDLPTTVDYVDLDRYQGTWYEIERYENSFQKKCAATRAIYGLNENGSVSVRNECFRKDKPGKLKVGKGTAFVTDENTQSKLKVSFVPFFQRFGWFAGEYWVLELDVDYRWALVGDSKREFLWILSRTTTLDQETLDYIKMKAEEQGFDSKLLKKSPVWNH